jgi:hypothetical protein
MDKTQGQGKAFKMSEQFTAVNTDDRLKKECLGIFENTDLKNKQKLTVIISTAISTLAVFAVLQFLSHTLEQECSNNVYSVNNLGLATLTGLAVGLINWVLGQIISNQIKGSLDYLQTQFQVLQSRLVEAEQKADRVEDEKKELQDKMSQIIPNGEVSYSNALTQETDFNSREEEVIEPPGTLLDFLDNLHNWFKVTTTPEQLLGSSTIEEVQQRKEELQYRQIWLQALEEETKRELQLLTLICQSSEQA